MDRYIAPNVIAYITPCLAYRYGIYSIILIIIFILIFYFGPFILLHKGENIKDEKR